MLYSLLCMYFVVTFHHGTCTDTNRQPLSTLPALSTTLSSKHYDWFQTQVLKTNLTSGTIKMASESDSFPTLICSSSMFVDNSLLIKHVLENEKTLVSLPRGFGKTINLSMVRFFFEVEIRNGKIVPQEETYAYRAFVHGEMECKSQNSEESKITSIKVMMNDDFLIKKLVSGDIFIFSKLGSLPVIYLDFRLPKSIRSRDELVSFMRNQILRAMNYQLTNAYQLASNDKSSHLIDELKTMINNTRSFNHGTFWGIPRFIDLLHWFYEEEVVILIDEYDAILNHVYFGAGAMDFDTNEKKTIRNDLANILYGPLKTSQNVEFVLVTGLILNWRYTDVFSEVRMCFFTAYGGDGDLAKFYGMSPDIVKEMLKEANMENHYGTVQYSYDGYDFGSRYSEIIKYNPYTVSKLIALRKVSDYMDFWTATGSARELLIHLFKYHQFCTYFKMVLGSIPVLIQLPSISISANMQDINQLTEVIQRAGNFSVNQNRQAVSNDDSIVHLGFWILLSTGYLTQDRKLSQRISSAKDALYVKIPNHEVLVALWMEFYSILDKKITPSEVLKKERDYRKALHECNDALFTFLKDNRPNPGGYPYYQNPNAGYLVDYYMSDKIKNLSCTFQAVLQNYMTIPWNVNPGEPNAYGDEELISGLLLGIANINLNEMQFVDAPRDQCYRSGVRRAHIVLKTFDGPLTVFEVKSVFNSDDLYRNMSLALNQAEKYVYRYLYESKFEYYRADKARAVAIVYSRKRGIVLIGATLVERTSEFKKSRITYLGNYPILHK